MNNGDIVKYSGAAGDYAGISVAGAGDVNGDGYDDILIGASGYSSNNGRVYLVLGQDVPVATILSSGADAHFSGGSANDSNGTSVAGAGDVNGDGYEDILFGAPGYPAGTDRGQACLILGSGSISGSLSASACYTGEDLLDYAGMSVAGAGDVNGDGYADMLIGAEYRSDDAKTSNGAVYLVLGSNSPTGGSLSPAIHTKYSGEASYDYFGIGVAGAGDVNGDGFADMLIGASNNDSSATDAGTAYLVLGDIDPYNDLSPIIQYKGEAANNFAGTGVAGAGDVNGDGFADILISASGNDDGGTNAGAAYLVLGSTNPTNANLSTAIQYSGEKPSDGVGGLAGKGDVNGDGFADILIGAFENDDSFTEAGAAYLIFSDYLTPGSSPIQQRQRVIGNSGDALPVAFDQAGARVDFAANAVANGEINVKQHIFHPCNTFKRLQTPIWSVNTNKLNSSSGSNLAMTFEYTDGQIAGMTEGNLGLWTRPEGQPCGEWTAVTGTSLNTNSNQLFVTLTFMAELGQFTIAETKPSPTSVHLLSGTVSSAHNTAPILGGLVGALVFASGAAEFYLRRRKEE